MGGIVKKLTNVTYPEQKELIPKVFILVTGISRLLKKDNGR